MTLRSSATLNPPLLLARLDMLPAPLRRYPLAAQRAVLRHLRVLVVAHQSATGPLLVPLVRLNAELPKLSPPIDPSGRVSEGPAVRTVVERADVVVPGPINRVVVVDVLAEVRVERD